MILFQLRHRIVTFLRKFQTSKTIIEYFTEMYLGIYFIRILHFERLFRELYNSRFSIDTIQIFGGAILDLFINIFSIF